MVKLEPSAEFRDNLELLLGTVTDPDLQRILRENTDKISALASNSTEATRLPIILELSKLIQNQVKADGGNQ